jgi:hypothetical protein
LLVLARQSPRARDDRDDGSGRQGDGAPAQGGALSTAGSGGRFVSVADYLSAGMPTDPTVEIARRSETFTLTLPSDHTRSWRRGGTCINGYAGRAVVMKESK